MPALPFVQFQTTPSPQLSATRSGARIVCRQISQCFSEEVVCSEALRSWGLNRLVECAIDTHGELPALVLRLAMRPYREWTPGSDTTRLCEQLHLDTQASTNDLQREIVLALLASPVPLTFPSAQEFLAAVRMRVHLVQAARRTVLDFGTAQAERPEHNWTYDEDRGFVIRPGCDLVQALEDATQPGEHGQRYSFSCYRASEYLLLLAIAKEAKDHNPALYAQLQTQWESRAIKSAEFHEVFLRELGSQEHPLPPQYWVPGDRTWFRNPDGFSSDASGYEGSWVIYLGNGEFSNFWKWQQPFTFTSKCVEIFHWRHATFVDEQGDLRIDEDKVAQWVATSLRDPAEVARILGKMQRLRDPQGIYQEGGCVDSSREFPKWVCAGSTDIVLPGV
ncbi:MAG: hypothetical protein HEQ39_15555 [Rhizobacter sp.]